MTREAKIGMLTGLGVIVLIGVLLSEYLGGGAAHVMSPTGRMAELPMGAAYRQEVTDPVGVPGMARTDGTAAAPGTTTPETVMASAGNVAAGTPSMPAPMGTNDATGAPAMGSAPAIGQATLDGAPTVQLGEPTSGQGTQVAYDSQQQTSGAGTVRFPDNTTAAGATPVKGTEYVIAPGDTLNKIAAKFFKNKSDGIKQIVAANPAVLKDDKAMLIAGKKLVIPAAVQTPKGVVAGRVVSAKKPAAVVIHQPGTANAAGADGASPAPPEAAGVKAKVYTVQAGDTLEKIAKRVAPSNVNAMVKKIEEANGIKDPTGLKVGQKLKVPTA